MLSIDELQALARETYPDPQVEMDRCVTKYQRTFSGPDGDWVLRDILTDLKYWDVATDAAHVIAQRIARHLLRKLGVGLDDDSRRREVEFFLREGHPPK